jgi:hypothetical protein
LYSLLVRGISDVWRADRFARQPALASSEQRIFHINITSAPIERVVEASNAG